MTNSKLRYLGDIALHLIGQTIEFKIEPRESSSSGIVRAKPGQSPRVEFYTGKEQTYIELPYSHRARFSDGEQVMLRMSITCQATYDYVGWNFSKKIRLNETELARRFVDAYSIESNAA
jgi:hypothetical protein